MTNIADISVIYLISLLRIFIIQSIKHIRLGPCYGRLEKTVSIRVVVLSSFNRLLQSKDRYSDVTCMPIIIYPTKNTFSTRKVPSPQMRNMIPLSTSEVEVEHHMIAVPDMLPAEADRPEEEGDHNLEAAHTLVEVADRILAAVVLVRNPAAVDVDRILGPEGDSHLAAGRTLHQEHRTVQGERHMVPDLEEERSLDCLENESLAHLECRRRSRWHQASA